MTNPQTDSDFLKALASQERDPIADLAQEIVEELRREVEARGTAWHDIELYAITEEILKKSPIVNVCP